MPTIEETFVMAERWHRGQTDKAGQPYIDHPRAVAALLAPHGPEAVKAGLLHDVLEDCGTTPADLLALGFSDLVVSAVQSVSWAYGEEYDDLIARAAAHPLGRHLKLADNASNTWPSRVARLAVTDRGKAERLAIKYAKARVRLLAAGATLTLPEADEAASTAEDLLPCPVLSPEGHWCSKTIPAGWKPSDGHPGGHWWTTWSRQLLIRGGHYDATAALSGMPSTGHLPEACPGPGGCDFWPYLDRAKRQVVEARLADQR